MSSEDTTGRHLSELMSRTLKVSPPFSLPPDVVLGCVDSRSERAVGAEVDFERAFNTSLAEIPARERAAGLNGVTGHIAESVVEALLTERGWTPLQHFEGPFSGGHGIDLAMATPDFEHLVAIEVKGSLQPRRWPRLAKGDLPQLSPAWLNKSDNPGISSLGVPPDELSAMAVLVQFSRRQIRAAWSADLVRVEPVENFDQLP